jgi:hypothetical protein
MPAPPIWVLAGMLTLVPSTNGQALAYRSLLWPVGRGCTAGHRHHSLGCRSDGAEGLRPFERGGLTFAQDPQPPASPTSETCLRNGGGRLRVAPLLCPRTRANRRHPYVAAVEPEAQRGKGRTTAGSGLPSSETVTGRISAATTRRSSAGCPAGCCCSSSIASTSIQLCEQ